MFYFSGLMNVVIFISCSISGLKYIELVDFISLFKCHLDNLSMVSDILPKISQNLTSSHSRNVGISKSFFYRAHITWNKLPYDLRSLESPSIFKSRLLVHLWNNIDEVIKNNCWPGPKIKIFTWFYRFSLKLSTSFFSIKFFASILPFKSPHFWYSWRRYR